MPTTYDTVNGPRTAQQMADELRNVGWDGAGEIKEVYARTTGGSVSQGSQGAPTAPTAPSPTSNQQGFNAEAARLASELADRSAQMAYNNAKLNLDTEDLAFRKAQQAWKETYDRALAIGQFPDGTQTLAALKQQADITGYYQGLPTLEREAEQNRTALGFLDLQSRLRGPNDPFQYLRTLAGTPQGITDIVNAAAGRYQLGGAPSGEMAMPATVGGQIANLNAATGGPTMMAPTQPTAPGPPNYSAIEASMEQQIGKGAWKSGLFRQLIGQGISLEQAVKQAADTARPYTIPTQPQPTAANPAVQAPMQQAVSPQNAINAALANLPKLPYANQIAPEQYNQMNPSQKAALWAAYEFGLSPTGAMRPEDAQAAYLKSLPKYTFSGTGAVRL